VTMESWPCMIHGWHGLVNAGVPEAAAAWARIRDYILETKTHGVRAYEEDGRPDLLAHADSVN
ncbi:MAG: hypothetical protein ACI9GB_003927, partial [Halioglobus sp.]